MSKIKNGQNVNNSNELTKATNEMNKVIKLAFKTFKNENEDLLRCFSNFHKIIKATNNAKLKALKQMLIDFNPFHLYGVMTMDEIFRHRYNKGYTIENVSKYVQKYLLSEDTQKMSKGSKINEYLKSFYDFNKSQTEKIVNVSDVANKTTIEKLKAEIETKEIETLKNVFMTFDIEDRKKASKTLHKAINKLNVELFVSLHLDKEKLREDENLKMKTAKTKLFEIHEATEKAKKELARIRQQIAKDKKSLKVESEKISA